MSENLVLRIKKNPDAKTNRSANYDVYLNDWKLGKGVFGITLEMNAPDEPILTIRCSPKWIEIDDLQVEAVIKDTSKRSE